MSSEDEADLDEVGLDVDMENEELTDARCGLFPLMSVCDSTFM
jgi:hypothetical protein